MIDEDHPDPLEHPEIHLLALSIVGALLCYAVTVVAARVLSQDGYERYVVAVAVIGICSSLGEAGVGKYALKALPGYRTNRQWSLHKGFWQFGILVSISVSLALAIGLISIEITPSNTNDNSTALMVAGLCLPFIALSGVAIDFVMANRAAMAGMIVSRIAIPGTTILGLCVLSFLPGPANASQGILCFGVGSLVGLILCTFIFIRTIPRQSLEADSEWLPWRWLRSCLSFAGFSILVTSLFRAAVIAFEWDPRTGQEVAFLSAAIDTGCLVLMVSKSTDKFFQPQLSEILERHDFRLGRMVRARRHVFVGSGCLVFLAMIAVFGKSILSLYGESFELAYPGLCMIAISTCLWTQFSLSPAYLNFVGMTRWVITATASALIMLILLTIILGGFYGVNGACAAFALVVGSLALVFYLRARIHGSQWFNGEDADTPASN